MKSSILFAFAAAIVLVAFPARGRADVFKSVKECAIGKRVETKDHGPGKITRIETNGVMCFVTHDDDHKETAYIFWMLRDSGASAETDDKLTPGVYECFAGGRYTFMDMRITGPNTYESAGVKGRFHVEPSRKIVFETGSLAQYHSKLLAGPSIGLNTNGDSFYATTCELNKTKR